MLEATIFDMDGVLAGTEGLKIESWRKVLEELTRGRVKNGGEWYATNLMGGPKDENTIRTIEKFHLKIIPDDFFRRRRKIYQKILEERGVIPIPWNISFLRKIYEDRRGIKLGLASGEYKEMIEHHLDSLGIKDYFDAITSGASEVNPRKQKPHPAVYLLTAEKLEVRPPNCLVIEDSSAGVESAKRAGMKCIGYQNPHSGNQDLSRADLITDDLSRLTLQQLNERLFGD